MTARWFGLAVMAAALVLPQAQATASDAHVAWENMQGERVSRSSAALIAEWLANWPDMVFLGRFESWAPNTVPYEGAAVVTCRIDSLVSGYWPDSTVSFSQISRPRFSAERLRPGTRLLGWSMRRCGPSGQACGAFDVVAEDGVLLHDYSDSDDVRDLAADPRPLRWQDLPQEILRADVISAMAATGGLAIATFRLDAKLPTGEILVRCVDPQWVIPSTASLPTLARFRPTYACSWRLAPTRYLLPIPVGYRGDTLSLGCCPTHLRVEDGRAMAFDLPLDSLSSVIGRDEGGRLHVRQPARARSGKPGAGTK